MGTLKLHLGVLRTNLSSQTPALSPNSIACPGLTFLREVGAEQVVLGILGQGLDVDGSSVSDGATKPLHLLVPLRCVQGEVEICGDTPMVSPSPPCRTDSVTAGAASVVPVLLALCWKLPSLRSSRLPALLLSYLT